MLFTLSVRSRVSRLQLILVVSEQFYSFCSCVSVNNSILSARSKKASGSLRLREELRNYCLRCERSLQGSIPIIYDMRSQVPFSANGSSFLGSKSTKERVRLGILVQRHTFLSRVESQIDIFVILSSSISLCQLLYILMLISYISLLMLALIYDYASSYILIMLISIRLQTYISFSYFTEHRRVSFSYFTEHKRRLSLQSGLWKREVSNNQFPVQFSRVRIAHVKVQYQVAGQGLK